MRLPVLLVLAVLVFGCRVRETAETKEPSEEHQSIVVRVKPAQRQKMSQVVEALGFCEALLDRAATVAPAVEGQVLRILAKPGDVVKAGQPLVQLDSRLAEANLREKKAARDCARRLVGSASAPLRPAEQKGYQLAIEDAKVGVAKATAVVARLQPLLQRGEIPPQQMFDAKLALDQARVQQEKAENEFRVQMLGARREAIEEAKRHVDAAETAVATARLQCDLLTIRTDRRRVGQNYLPPRANGRRRHSPGRSARLAAAQCAGMVAAPMPGSFAPANRRWSGRVVLLRIVPLRIRRLMQHV